MSKIDDNGLEENKKSYIKYGGNLPGGKGHFLTSEPLTDDEIEEILKHGEEVKKENDMILKSSYGHNFVNVENLEKKKSHSSQFIWSPFVAYYGVDPENEQYFKKQVVSIHHVEGNIHECTPDSVHYRGTTHWYDGFAFEIKKEIRNSYSLEDLKKEKDVTTITRKDGLIIVEWWTGSKKIFFDTGCLRLPEYDEDSNSYCFEMELKKNIELNPNVPSEVAPVIEQALNQYRMFGKEQAISATEPIDREQIMEQFERNVSFTQNFSHPNWQIYINQKREELLKAIEKQEREQEYQRRSEPLLKEINELKTQNYKLQKMLNTALTFAQTVSNSRVGKLFFGKKAKEVLGDQDKYTKQLPEGR